MFEIQGYLGAPTIVPTSLVMSAKKRGTIRSLKGVRCRAHEGAVERGTHCELNLSCQDENSERY